MAESKHKSGFVSIVGRPNVGKSTIMNALVKENLSIITHKAQTTRHRIRGILTGEGFQIVFSDTPGIIQPDYKLQETMMYKVDEALEDADLILFVVEFGEKPVPAEFHEKIKNVDIPKILVINKVDLAKDPEEVITKVDAWQKILEPKAIVAASALENFNVDILFDLILENIPEHPAYYDADEVTDKSSRFFASEMIREAILTTYEKEVPYSCEVVIDSFKDSVKDDIIRVSAQIFVERESQKGILIGQGGQKLKKVGIEARKSMEEFFGKQIFLETFVKVEPNWRRRKEKLKKFGYLNS